MASLAVPLALGGIQALAGLFGSRPQTTTSDGSNHAVQQNTYNYTPQQQALINQLMQQHQNALNGVDLSGYQTAGLKNINDTGQASQIAIQNMLAQRGLSYSPAAATSLTQQRVGQAGQQSDFLNNLPLLQYKLKTDALTNAGNFMNAQRVNSTQTTDQTSHVTQKGSGNMTGGLFAGLGTGLADTLGRKFANQGAK